MLYLRFNFSLKSKLIIRSIFSHFNLSEFRRLGRDAQLFTERQLAAVASEPNVWNVLSYTVPFRQCPIPTNFDALEYSHTNIVRTIKIANILFLFCTF